MYINLKKNIDQPHFQGWSKQKFFDHLGDPEKKVEILRCSVEDCQTEFAFFRDVTRQQIFHDFEFDDNEQRSAYVLFPAVCRNLTEHDANEYGVCCANPRCRQRVGRRIGIEFFLDKEMVEKETKILLQRCVDKKISCIHA